MPIRRLLYDIETSPNVGLFWKAGYKQEIRPDAIIHERKVITIAWKFHGEKKIRALDWGKKQDDRPMLEEFIPILNDADESVAHYGDGFDLKWLRTRALFHRIRTLSVYRTIDTCAWASKHFLLNSNKLDYLARFLGLGGKLPTDYSLWKEIVLHNSEKALRYMVRYNKGDVRLLESVFDEMSVVCPANTHVGVLDGKQKWTCPRDGSRRVNSSKTRVTASGQKKIQMQCLDCGHYFSINEKAYAGYLKR